MRLTKRFVRAPISSPSAGKASAGSPGWTGLAAVLGLAAAQTCPAQTAPAADAPVSEVIVHASRFPANRGDADFSQIDLGASSLESAPSLDEALKDAVQASLFRRTSSLTANPTIQGLSLREIGPSGAGRALVTVNGIPQNDPFGNWVIWSAIPQDAVESVHVLRGAGGGAYGGGALTGVVDIGLQSPQTQPAYADAAYGEGGSSKFALAGGVGDVALHYFSRTLSGDTPVRGAQAGPADVPTAGDDRALLLNSETPLCPVADCGDISVLAGGVRSDRRTGLSGASGLSTGNQLALSYAKQPNQSADGLRGQVWHNESGLSNLSTSINAGRFSTTLADDQFKTPAEGTGAGVALRHQAGASQWEIGLAGRINSGESEDDYKYVSGLATRERIAGGKTSLAGAYGQATQTFGAFTITGALRADVWRAYAGHRTETDTTTGLPTLSLRPAAQRVEVVSGRAGLQYAVTPEASLRLAAYNGFRPPSLNELYRPYRIGNNVTEANDGLRPETLQGVEFGGRYNSKRFTFDSDVFLNNLSDPITNVTLGAGPGSFGNAGFIPAGGTYSQRENLGQIKAYGLESQAQLFVSAALSLTSSVTLTHARIDDARLFPQLNGLRPAEAPDYSASFGLLSRLGRLKLKADVLFEGKTFDDDLNTLPLKPSRNLSLNLSYLLTPAVTTYLSVYNGLNDRIAITHTSDGVIGYDNRRTLWVGVTYRQ